MVSLGRMIRIIIVAGTWETASTLRRQRLGDRYRVL